MNERRIHALYHFLALFMFVVPAFGIFATAALSFFRKNKSLTEENHARAVLNFQLSIVLYAVLIFLFLPRPAGIVVGIFLSLAAVMMMIYNGVLALKGEQVNYPLAMTLLKPAVKAQTIEEMLYRSQNPVS